MTMRTTTTTTITKIYNNQAEEAAAAAATKSIGCTCLLCGCCSIFAKYVCGVMYEWEIFQTDETVNNDAHKLTSKELD